MLTMLYGFPSAWLPCRLQEKACLLMQAMVNRYCPASKRGEVNGTSQSLASLVRAVGPFFGGLLWGVFSGLALPGAQLIPFAIISAITLATALIYIFMPTI